MSLQLFTLDDHPNQIVVSKIDSFVEDGKFFLDFSRPLEFYRWLGVFNSWIGFPVSIFVPIIHQSEERGGFKIGIHRSEPNYSTILKIWRERYPSSTNPSTTESDGLKVVADFGVQFPSDC